MPTLAEFYALSGFNTVAAVGLDCAPKSAGGIRKAWVGDRDSFGTWRLEETGPLQFGRIAGSSKPGAWFPIYPQWQVANYTEVSEGVPTRGYSAQLNLPYSRMSVPHRDAFERMAKSDRCAFLAEDLNGAAWLFGEHDGCLVSTAFDSQNAAAGGRYSIVADCRQTWPLRQVASGYLAAINANANRPPLSQVPTDTINTTSFVTLLTTVIR